MSKIDEREYEFLIRLFDQKDTQFILEILKASEIELGSRKIYSYGKRIVRYTVYINVDPQIYIQYQSDVVVLGGIIAEKYAKIKNIKLHEIVVTPELSKFHILKNPIKTILTPWAEINSGQDDLIKKLESAINETDYQNIGNTSRSLLQKLSNIVFDENKHIGPEGIDLSEGKFRNRFHTYLKTELGGSQNEELRDYVNSLITTTEKAVDLSNKTTHDLKAYKLMAETCVISVVTVISIVKLVSNHSFN